MAGFFVFDLGGNWCCIAGFLIFFFGIVVLSSIFGRNHGRRGYVSPYYGNTNWGGGSGSFHVGGGHHSISHGFGGHGGGFHCACACAGGHGR
jgi:hypothetical protein